MCRSFDNYKPGRESKKRGNVGCFFVWGGFFSVSERGENVEVNNKHCVFLL